MPAKHDELPHFVRKQVEKASAELARRRPEIRWQLKTVGTRVLIQQQLPHPHKPETLLIPLALLDYRAGTWHLLFRDSDGGWQPVPGSEQSPALHHQLQLLLNDAYGLFLCQ